MNTHDWDCVRTTNHLTFPHREREREGKKKTRGRRAGVWSVDVPFSVALDISVNSLDED